MTRFDADAPGDRRALVAEAVLAHRKRGSEAADFEAAGRRLSYTDRVLTVPVDGEAVGTDRETGETGHEPGESAPETGETDPETRETDREARETGRETGAIDREAGETDRETVDSAHGDERDRLDALLDDYPVFKVEQPATRKADDDVVYVSAIADPKHVADFVDDCFRRVYGLPDGYELWATRI